MTISEETRLMLVNRVKSLGWRVGMMLAAGLIAIATEAISSVQLPGGMVVLLGLVLGEISKYINARLSLTN